MLLLCLLAMLCQTPGPEPPPSLLMAEPEPIRRMGLDVIVGSPLGLAVRLQRRLDSAPIFVEGSIGTFFFGSGVGIGVRREFANELGRCDTLVARPGVSLYFIALSELIFEDQGVGVVAVDVDLAWQHRYSWGGIGEFGVKLGPGITIGRSDPKFLAIIGLYHGWRF
jgi:hypothetical protein